MLQHCRVVSYRLLLAFVALLLSLVSSHRELMRKALDEPRFFSCKIDQHQPNK